MPRRAACRAGTVPRPQVSAADPSTLLVAAGLWPPATGLTFRAAPGCPWGLGGGTADPRCAPPGPASGCAGRGTMGHGATHPTAAPKAAGAEL